MQIHSIVALQFLTNVTGRNFSAFRAIFLSAKRSLALLSAPFMQLRHILLAYFLPFDLGEERPRTSIIEFAIRGERAHETSRRAMNNFVGAKSRLLAPPYTSFPLVLVFLHARARVYLHNRHCRRVWSRSYKNFRISTRFFRVLVEINSENAIQDNEKHLYN